MHALGLHALGHTDTHSRTLASMPDFLRPRKRVRRAARASGSDGLHLQILQICLAAALTAVTVLTVLAQLRPSLNTQASPSSSKPSPPRAKAFGRKRNERPSRAPSRSSKSPTTRPAKTTGRKRNATTGKAKLNATAALELARRRWGRPPANGTDTRLSGPGETHPRGHPSASGCQRALDHWCVSQCGPNLRAVGSGPWRWACVPASSSFDSAGWLKQHEYLLLLRRAPASFCGPLGADMDEQWHSTEARSLFGLLLNVDVCPEAGNASLGGKLRHYTRWAAPLSAGWSNTKPARSRCLALRNASRVTLAVQNYCWQSFVTQTLLATHPDAFYTSSLIRAMQQNDPLLRQTEATTGTPSITDAHAPGFVVIGAEGSGHHIFNQLLDTSLVQGQQWPGEQLSFSTCGNCTTYRYLGGGAGVPPHGIRGLFASPPPLPRSHAWRLDPEAPSLYPDVGVLVRRYDRFVLLLRDPVEQFASILTRFWNPATPMEQEFDRFVAALQMVSASLPMLPPRRTFVLVHDLLRQRRGETAAGLATFLGVPVSDERLWSFVDRVPPFRCHLVGNADPLRSILLQRSWGRWEKMKMAPWRCSTSLVCATRWRRLFTQKFFSPKRVLTYRNAISTSFCSTWGIIHNKKDVLRSERHLEWMTSKHLHALERGLPEPRAGTTVTETVGPTVRNRRAVENPISWPRQ